MNEKIDKKVLESVPQVLNHQFTSTATAAPEIMAVEAKDLDTASFPKRSANLDEIMQLAYTFDGYAELGMEACAELANQSLSTYYHEDKLPEDLQDLRACLFFEARRWQLYQALPDTKANIYMFALMDKLKAKVLELQG